MAAINRLMSATDYAGRNEQNADDREEDRSLQELPKVRYASKVAITCLPGRRSRKVVYSHIDLYKMVEKIATELREIGVRPNTVCAMALHNSVEAIVYFLAVVWIGAIAAPIDINLDVDDVLKVLRAVKATTIVSPLIDEDETADDPLFQRMKKGSEELGLIEWHISRTTNEGVVLETHGRRAAEGAAWAGGASDFKPDCSNTAVHVASVDENSTVVLPLTHQNFATAIRALSTSYQIGVEDSTILSHSWHHVDALNSILATIYSGGHLIIPPSTLEPDESFLKACSEYKVDWFTGSPEFLSKLADNAASGGMHLKFIRCVTGNLSAEELKSLEEKLNTTVHESYGTPETCGIVSSNILDESRQCTKGAPVAACDVKIFEEEGRLPVDPETVGLVGVSGLHVTSGYLDNDELNLKHIIKEENEDGSERIFFLTGDRGYLDQDGFLHIDTPSIEKDMFAHQREIRDQASRSNPAAAIEIASSEEAGSSEVDESEENDSLDREEKEAEEKEILDRELAQEKERLEREAAEEQERIEKEKAEAEEKERFEREAAELAEKERREREAAEEEEKERLRLEREEKERLEREEEDAKAITSSSSSAQDNRQSRGLFGILGVVAGGAIVANAKSTSSSSASSSSASEKSGILEVSPRDVKKTNVETSSASSRAESGRMDTKSVEEIMERLSAIEENQRRFEAEVMANHRLEVAALKELIDATTQELDSMKKQPLKVDMADVTERLNLASEAVSVAAQQSIAASAAAKAANASGGLVEVEDPSKISKTVVVDLKIVEHAMEMHPAVMTAKCFGRRKVKKQEGVEGTGNEMEICCCLALQPSAVVSTEWLKIHATHKLAASNLPKYYYIYDGLTAETERKDLADGKIKGMMKMETGQGVTRGAEEDDKSATGGQNQQESPTSRKKKNRIFAPGWSPGRKGTTISPRARAP